MPRDNRAIRIKRFAMFLEQAVHDEQHVRAKDARVVHFWDADSIFFTAFGFRAMRSRDFSSNTVLAQALLSAGLIGPVTMLSHHRVELFSQLDRRVRDIEERGTSDSDELDLFLDSHPAESAAWDDAVPTLRRAVSSGTMEATLDAVRSLQSIKRDTFVLFEATTDTFANRLRRVLADSSLVDYGAVDLPSTKQVLGDPRFSMFLEGVMRYRHLNHQTANIAADAAALTTLAILNERANTSSEPVFPRFFTSTASLRQLYSSEEWVRQELQYVIRGERNRLGTVWRGPYYYVLRTMFPALDSSRTFAPAALVPDRPRFEQLVTLSNELINAVRAGDGDVEDMADSYLLSDGKPLWDVIEDLEDSGRAAAWLRIRPSEYAKRWSEGVSAIRGLSTNQLTRDAINRVFADTTVKMRSEVLDAACHTGLIRAYSAVTSPAGNHQMPAAQFSRIDQLASIRWGVPARKLLDFLGVGEKSSHVERSLKLSSVRWLLRSPRRLECASVCLLAVDDYTTVRRLLGRLPASKHSPGLLAIGLAAKIRESRVFTPYELEETMMECQRTFESLGDSDQVRHSVAFGYVAFHVWRRSSFASDPDAPNDDLHWASWSSSIVEDRLDSMEPELMRFALNHVVYVQSVANLLRPNSFTMASRLKELAEVTGLYRLADTVGHRMTLTARRDPLWQDNRAAWLLAHQSELDEASAWLRKAQMGAVSDREVDQHREFLDATLRDAQFG